MDCRMWSSKPWPVSGPSSAATSRRSPAQCGTAKRDCWYPRAIRPPWLQHLAQWRANPRFWSTWAAAAADASRLNSSSDAARSDWSTTCAARMPDASGQAEPGAIAYVLKGFPRMSETFIAGEIYRLEQAGLRLRLFATKRDEAYRHPVVDRIQAPLVYLPPVRSPSRSASLLAWFATNAPAFRSALVRCARRRPLGLARAAAAAFAQAMRARWSWSRPRGVYFKEFLQAVALADRLLETSDVCHIHAHFAHGATTVAWLAGMICGLPFSFTAHATDIYRESVNPAGLLRRKLAAARFVVTCTQANRAYLEERAGRTAVRRAMACGS